MSQKVLLVGTAVDLIATMIYYYSKNKQEYKSSPRFGKKSQKLTLTKKIFALDTIPKTAVYTGVNNPAKINKSGKVSFHF